MCLHVPTAHPYRYPQPQMSSALPPRLGPPTLPPTSPPNNFTSSSPHPVSRGQSSDQIAQPQQVLGCMRKASPVALTCLYLATACMQLQHASNHLIARCILLFRFWEGIYVLYTYAAKRTTSQKVQKHLSTPIVGGEANVLRHMTFRTS